MFCRFRMCVCVCNLYVKRIFLSFFICEGQDLYFLKLVVIGGA